MTKETYFEMCETLGQEPIESEIPIDSSDLPLLVQDALSVYNMLEDKWDSMGGGYLGKNYSGVFEFLRLYEIEENETLLVIDILQHLDSVRAKLVADKLKTK